MALISQERQGALVGMGVAAEQVDQKGRPLNLGMGTCSISGGLCMPVVGGSKEQAGGG